LADRAPLLLAALPRMKAVLAAPEAEAGKQAFGEWRRL
jgi:hypothetical protein